MNAVLSIFLVSFAILVNQLTAFGQTAKPHVRTDALLEDLLRAHPEYFGKILESPDSFKVQIIYTQIDRDQHNQASFKNYYFHVDSLSYFYPASTVKLPTVLLTLQKINELNIPGLDKFSSMITEKSYNGQTAVYNDPTSLDGSPSIANYIKKILLVSDNDAFNRLYEFLGPDYLNNQLHKMGYSDVQILHRLSLPLSEDENRHTNPMSFYNALGKKVYEQPMQVSLNKPESRNDSVGKAYFNGADSLVSHPMDFSKKNRISLSDLHHILQSVIFPASIPADQRFKLDRADYRFIYQYLSQFPRETYYPRYDSASHWDGQEKLLFWGSEKGTLPKNIRIFNKEGDAYGFLTDISYFVDFEKQVEFMLSATIYCNADGVLNDDKYDYDAVGLPFMKQLGRVIYDLELKRKRQYPPNLSDLKMPYDK